MLKSIFPLLLLPALAPAQAVSAGTVLSNQAAASYQVASAPRTVLSAPVQTTVNAVCGVQVGPNGTLQSPGQQARALPGQNVTFSYRLENTGNARTTFNVQARGEGGGDFVPGAQLYHDLNGNGQPELGEVLNGTLSLDAGAGASLLLVATATGTQGWGAVNLVASCGENGMQDSDNMARIDITPPPALSVTKHFSQPLIRPGDTAQVTVSATNKGGSVAQAVTLTDPLAAQVAQGLRFVPGSARSSGGTTEFTADGRIWSATEPALVQGVRLRADRLESGQQLSLYFDVQATAQAEGRTFVNVADLAAEYGGGQQASDALDVRYRPGVALGPLGQPTAPDATGADTQSRPFAVVGQNVCFDHTVQNTGDVSDTFTFTVAFPQGQASATLLGADDQPLAAPLALGAGASATVRVCYLPQTGPLEAAVTVRGARGTQNATTDRIERLESGLPKLVKTVSKSGDPDWAPERAVVSGDILNYTLSVTNPYRSPLHGVQVRDPLPAHVDYLGASGGAEVTGNPDARVLTWSLGTLQPGETRQFTVQVRVNAGARDDEQLRNVFELTSTEFGTPLESNAATATVWNAAPFIGKAVSAPQVSPGDQVTYTLSLKNTSTTSALVDVVVTDTPAATLAYVPGTSRVGERSLADPERRDGALVWKVERIDPKQVLNLTYTLRVLPGASGELSNTVVMQGRGEQARASAVASNRAVAITRVKLLNFTPLADILGAVYLDRNGNGRQDAGESGVGGARVLLAGGRTALTDPQGRYHFANVALGTQALRLDPGSVPTAPRDSTRTVQVQGLTTVDFPLPTGNVVTALRDVDVQAGPLKLHKVVTPIITGPVSGPVTGPVTGYRVTLTLDSDADLPQLQLTDPLPAGARLVTGQRTFSGPLQAGNLTLSYEFEWSGSSDQAVTDPLVRLGGQP